ncbi:unnamed protein product [Peronospora belbahrii]|uniref:Calreticulin n=1 Tax=Peronospora belbahrii TaxID=622444 RepID=A0AAU9LEN5_9STRA|nr:unnamed protein product [Peronospora belbahrii]CAH0516668.1 unnamed protein product [Peronospora belbahrii]
MLPKLVVALAAVAATVAHAKTIFRETFDDDEWESRWISSTWKPASEVGKFEQVTGKYYINEDDKAIKTSEDARFYALTSKFKQPFNNKGKDLYLSYLVQHEQNLDCGGAYIKLLPADLDQTTFGGESPYAVMFGPDICGVTKKTHAILNYARPGKEAVNMDNKDTIRAESDSDPHLYSFVLKQENTYEVKIDGKSIKNGTLAEDWPFQPDKQIKDPDQSKPKDWVDEKQIPDPEDKKPAGYDDIPKTIPDPDAVKPEDWDDEDDGEWEPAMIENPEYEGEWKPKMIDNPEYKGEWEHPLVDNPEYFEDESFYNVVKNVGAIGFDLWQVASGTLFDDILLTDSEEEFTVHEDAVMEKVEAMLKKKKEIQDEEKKEAEAKAKEEEAKAKEEEAKAKEAEDNEEADDTEEADDKDASKDKEKKEETAEDAEESEVADQAEKDEL